MACSQPAPGLTNNKTAQLLFSWVHADAWVHDHCASLGFLHKCYQIIIDYISRFMIYNKNTTSFLSGTMYKTFILIVSCTN